MLPAPLRHRAFRLFWTAELASRMGFWVQLVGQSWLVWHLSGSTLTVGMVAAAQLVPSLLLAPLGGLLADRLPRRWLLLVTQVALALQALAMWRLVTMPQAGVALVAVAAAVSGALSAVDTPTRLSLIPTLVPDDMVQQAVAVDTTSVTLARVIGPALAAAVLATAGPAACYLANGLSYLPVILVLAALRLKAPLLPPQPTTSWLTGLREGFRFAQQNAAVRQSLIVLAVFVVLTMNAPTLLPSFADRVLRAGPRGLGLLIAAQGCGALVGTTTKRRLLFPSVRGSEFLLPAVVASLSMVILSVSRWLWPALLLMTIVGLAQSRLIVGVQRLLQRQAPEHLRGRVMALFSQVMLGGVPLGALLAGALAGATSAPAAFAIEGAVAAVVVVALVSYQEVVWPRSQSLGRVPRSLPGRASAAAAARPAPPPDQPGEPGTFDAPLSRT